jgi:hypothetical protein
MEFKHYLFEDGETDECFIVGAFTIEEAWGIAWDNFKSPSFCYVMSEFEAENSGLDEY